MTFSSPAAAARPGLAIILLGTACWAAELWTPSAELLWPDDDRARLAEVHAALHGKSFAVSGWPATGNAICGPTTSLGEKHNPSLRRACLEGGPKGPMGLALNLHIQPAGILRPLGSLFETFDPGWGSFRTDPELARVWSDLPPSVGLDFRHAFSPRVFARFRMGLRRDFAAWRLDDFGLNLPLSAAEVDLNEPSFGYLSYAGDWLDLAVGRFPVHWGPSSEFGLALSSSVPYHNAALIVVKASRLRYRFLVSSLNPWLEGTPLGDTSSTTYPAGSEEWRQRNYPVLPGSENAHRRVHDARIKTLIAHRLETWAGPLTLGVTETEVIGGKPPDLRDANPFAVFHNDFHEGYANNNVSLDALLRLPAGFSVATEVFMDDLEWSETEGSGASPSLLGYLGVIRHAFRAGGWDFSQSLHGIYTDPYLYGFLQPLNTYTSRTVLTSNYQRKGDPVFVDKYVVDYPLGYLRGGDALDYWYRVDAWRGRELRLTFRAAWLSRGELGTNAPYEGSFQPHGSSPSGRPERETRVTLDCAWSPDARLTVRGGLGWSTIRNRSHGLGGDRADMHASLGIGSSFPWR